MVTRVTIIENVDTSTWNEARSRSIGYRMKNMVQMQRTAVLLVAAAVVCALLLPLAGCQEAAKTAKKTKTIRLVRNLGGREGFKQHVNAWKAAFEKASPGWTLEVVDLGNSDAGERYKSWIATDDLPEIVQTWALTNVLADGGHLQPIPESFFTRHGIPLPEPYKGKYYTTQGGVQISGIAVNKAMWAKAGITAPPSTWVEFVDDLRKIKSAGMNPLVFGGKEWSAAMPLKGLLETSLYSGKKESWTKRRDAGEVKFATDPDVQTAIQATIDFLKEFANKGTLSNGYNEEQRDFYTGKAATWVMGCWIGGELEPNKVEFDVLYWPFPGSSGAKPKFLGGGVTVQSGWAITTSAKGDAYDTTLKVFDAFYEPEVYQLYLNGEAMLKLAEKVPGVNGPKSSWPAAQRFFDDMAANYKAYGCDPGALRSLDDQWPPSFTESIMRVTQEILAGNSDVPKLAKMLDDDWDNSRKAK
jgi:ABC-type glycerol-3-phosphate transport system substrate-binding protein